MVTVKKEDFVEIEYTGKIKEDSTIFDTTSEKVAKESDIYNKDMRYGSVIICLGEGQILKGLEKALEGKDTDKEYTVELAPEEGFGKKDPKMIQLIQTSKFKKQGIQPMPGLQINVDGMLGIVKTVSGGRTLVDFNNPLSGRDLVYTVRIKRKVEDDKEKIEGYVKLSLGLKDVSAEMKEGNAKIKIKKELPDDIKDKLTENLKRLVKSIKTVGFTVEKEEKEQKG
ncbi:peptidylprolyl isomerase [Candidatus Woesearchaeota archaeon]|nr:peptidylprolyl isomerase [Candidatus Woesearchaeota archaeon]